MIQESIIKLLKTKKQIILQGPPGTGKTRMAKEIAKKISNEIRHESLIDSIDELFKTYKPLEVDLKKRHELLDLLNQFQKKFPKEKLEELTLEDYALGLEDLGGFCWWLEYNLQDAGQYNGQATKGKIYWSKGESTFKKSGFVKDIEDDNEAMEKVAELLHIIANEKFDNPTKLPIGKGFVLKMLNTYHPEKYFPVYNEKILDKLLNSLGQETSYLNYIEKSKKVMSIFNSKKEKNETDITSYEFMNFLFNDTNLSGNVTVTDKKLVSKGNFKVIQFHPSYSYEDFVRGVSVKTNSEGKVSYSVEDRILIEMAKEALNNPKSDYVLIVDEINRANLSVVLGELIYALEYRYNNKNREGIVESLYDKNMDGEQPDRELKLPNNLYIIGTMNTADRSVGNIDYAVRRRFAFVDVTPKILDEAELDGKKFALEEFKTVSSLFVTNDIKEDNMIFEPSEHLSEEFRPEDVWLGHSYFIYDDGNLNIQLKYEIIPILKEYVKDGILKESALEIINSLG